MMGKIGSMGSTQEEHIRKMRGGLTQSVRESFLWGLVPELTLKDQFQ